MAESKKHQEETKKQVKRQKENEGRLSFQKEAHVKRRLRRGDVRWLKRSLSLDSVRKPIQDLKDADRWDPECAYASEALEKAYMHQKYDECDLLVKKGVLLAMKSFPGVVDSLSLESVKKAIKHLKGTDNWDPGCAYASKALEKAYMHQNYDVCDLLVKKGVSLTMKSLPTVVDSLSLESVKKAIKHLKGTDNWDPGCAYASKALEKAYMHQNYDVYDLLVKKGVSLTMKSLPTVVDSLSLESVKKAIKHLKGTDNWDPGCAYASKALEKAYRHRKDDVRDLLIQEGVSLTMKNFPGVVDSLSLKSVKKAIKHLKITENWNPGCVYASKALEKPYRHQKYDVCDLLVQEGVSLTMKSFAGVVDSLSLKCVKKAIKHLKVTEIWDPGCAYASKALEKAYRHQKYDVYDLLVKKGVPLTMKSFPGVVDSSSLESVRKAIKQLKVTDNWDPECAYASKALEKAYRHRIDDVRDLLIQEGVSLTMKNFPGVVDSLSLKSVKKAIKHLKITENWNPGCVYASKALEKPYRHQKYDVCDLLVQEGVSLTMKSFAGVVDSLSLKCVKKAIKHLKVTEIWDPGCAYASKALEKAYRHQKYDLYDLLIQEGVSLTIKGFPAVADSLSLKSVKKATRTNIPSAVTGVQFEPVTKEMQHLQVIGSTLKATEKPSMLSGSSHHENEDVKLTYEDFTHLKEIISAGPDNKKAVDIVDTIKTQEDKRLKTKVFQYLAGLLRDEIISREKHAKVTIWPGTKIFPTEEIKFVCLYKGKLETQLQNFFGIDIHYKDMDIPEPLIDMENHDLLNWEMTDQDASLLQSAIEEHGDTLFKEHSNLQVICGGPFLLRNGRVLKQSTIILYCHVKGIIPYGEDTFPSLLKFNGIDIPVDIREGHCVLAVGRQEWQETLCMGISIGEKGMAWAGTLGPFVDLGHNEYGFLTCAHVVGDEGTQVVQPSKGESGGRQKSEKETICGTVVKRVFAPEFSDRMNGLTKTGVDAALVKLNKDRGIEATNFPFIPEADLNLIGFGRETKFHYVGGGIGCPLESRKARGKMVIKYGRTTGLSKGVMVLEGAMVKIDDPELYYKIWDRTFTMKGQFLVDGIAGYQFAAPGDSGAGVFALDDENKLTLIGLVAGVLDARFDHRCIVTPIEHILTALELTPHCFKFHEKIEID